MGRRESQQLGDSLRVPNILADTFLEHAAELPPEGRIGVGPLLREVVEQGEDPLDRCGPDRVDVPRVLQDLPRDVQRQVVRVDHPTHEAQVARHQLLGVVHDEHASDVELDAVTLLAVPEVERRPLRDVEQEGVLLHPFGLDVGVGERRLEIVRDVLVELVVLLLGDLRFRSGPERRRLVDLLGLLGPPPRLTSRPRVPPSS